jgi:hypothetical protein
MYSYGNKTRLCSKNICMKREYKSRKSELKRDQLTALYVQCNGFNYELC